MLILLMGPSGVGKTSVIQEFVDKKGWKPIMSLITRPMRIGERFKITVPADEYDQRLGNGELFSHVEQIEYKYGTLKVDIDNAVASPEKWLLDFSLHHYHEVFKQTPHIPIVIVPESLPQLALQLEAVARSERIEHATEQLDLSTHIRFYSLHRVINRHAQFDATIRAVENYCSTADILTST